ncbi:hypothetical protein M501DRAFT_810988 [Patellaria atrata CBS 101060]|uniref:Uncharacterized protein n=1 Tax=Patellaria atrata CBS 101060 TaxID=1346257 RepID=A0A9P4VMD6_9PEZI|nr:hypothetical protein M501DRAFT_810988 [Patellaria atrata CBS 101060]
MPPTKHVEHDSKSGLTYKESQVKVRSMLPDWIDKTTGCNREIKRFRNKGRGVPSLEAMATRCLLLNAKELRLDTFENVPWVLGKKIWEEFRKHHLDSFRVWQIFANAYSKEKHPHIQYRKLIFNPWERFFLIPQSLNPPYFNGLTYLTITSGDLTPADLSLLPQLANLAVLSMSGGATKVNDIYIQTWHNEVIENSAFPKLRVLYFAHQPRVTVNSLPLLAAFPMLKACHMTGASFVDTTDEELSGTGWQRKGR